jgi:hypothetical protein
MAASLVMLAVAGKYWSAVAAVLFFSASWSALINVINPIAAIAFGGSKTYAMNLACFYFGLGAFGTPLALRLLLRRSGLTKALLLLAGMVLVPAVLGAWADFSTLVPPARELAATAPSSGMAGLLRDPVMWLCTLAFLFYGYRSSGCRTPPRDWRQPWGRRPWACHPQARGC